MTDENALQTTTLGDMAERVLLQGDLSKLSPAERVNYYTQVCKSIGLNPLTRPFDYINLNGKLTLYAKKDAADQLRNIHGVSVDDVEVQETPGQFIVKVKGHNRAGRTDVEIGVVNKTDMRGDTANAQMKAVTKAKRRLTLSLCGLGWLDETEIPTIPDAAPVTVDERGEIESPIQKGIRLYRELSTRAAAVNIQADDLPDNATIDQVRAAYKELERFVKDAESQAAQ